MARSDRAILTSGNFFCCSPSHAYQIKSNSKWETGERDVSKSRLFKEPGDLETWFGPDGRLGSRQSFRQEYIRRKVLIGCSNPGSEILWRFILVFGPRLPSLRVHK